MPLCAQLIERPLQSNQHAAFSPYLLSTQQQLNGNYHRTSYRALLLLLLWLVLLLLLCLPTCLLNNDCALFLPASIIICESVSRSLGLASNKL